MLGGGDDVVLRPSVPRTAPTTTYRSAVVGGRSICTVIVPSTNGRSSRSLDQPPVQSRAAQVIGVVDSNGVQVAATIAPEVEEVALRPSRDPTGPGKIRSPSPGRRAGPHAKHVGNGWCRCPA